MENIMMLPASYCVMNEEEMTYTTGGASAIQAIAAVSYTHLHPFSSFCCGLRSSTRWAMAGMLSFCKKVVWLISAPVAIKSTRFCVPFSRRGRICPVSYTHLRASPG